MTLFATTSRKSRFAETGLDSDAEHEEALVDSHIHAELTANAQVGSVTGTYVVPMPPVVLGIIAFVAGAAIALLVMWVWQRWQASQRKEKMLKPLLSSR